MPSSSFPTRRTVLGAVASTLLAACGGGGGGSDDPPAGNPAGPLAGVSVARLREGPAGTVLLLEAPARHVDPAAPRRAIALRTVDGAWHRWQPDAGWRLLDVAVHPSGELSLLLAQDGALGLVRLDASARQLDAQRIPDPQVASDPVVDATGPLDPQRQLPVLTQDAARIAPSGEAVIVAHRTGVNAAVVARYVRRQGRFERAWRTLVAPGMTVMPRGTPPGSFDPLRHWHLLATLQMDVHAGGRIAVAVPGGPGSDLFYAHETWSGQALGPVNYGALVTQLDADGRRLGTTLVDTTLASELHALRATGAGFVLAGRIRREWQADGSGWDGWVASVSLRGALEWSRRLDGDRGDAVFDVAERAGGELLAVGASGYLQDARTGAVSEHAAPLMARLRADGTVAGWMSAPAGPRHNQLRAVDASGSGWRVGGLQDGPGTHSADHDPQALRVQGVLFSAR